MIKTTLGDYIITKRKQLKISSRKLALLCDITPAYLNDIKNNKRIPSFEVLNRIASHLNLHEEEIYQIFDLAATGRKGKVSYDISEYIMSNAKLRQCIRRAIKNNDDSIWDKVLK